MTKEIILKTWVEENGQMKCAFKQEDMGWDDLARSILELEKMVNVLKTKFWSQGKTILKNDK